MERDKFEVSWATLWRIFFMLLFVAALFLAQQALIVLFLAIIISASLDGIVSYLQKNRVPRILGTLFIFLSILAIFAVLLYTLVPVTIFELQNFLGNLKKIEIPVLGAFDLSRFIGIDKYLGNLGNLAEVLFSGGTSFFDVVSGIFGNLVQIIAILIISFYLTVNRGGVEKFLRTILPINQENYVISIYHQVRKKLGLWLQGEVFMMLVVGTVSALGLWLLGVKYSLILGILAGLSEIVPVVGPIFSGALAFLVAVPQSLTLGIYVILLFLVIQQTEGHLLLPLVMNKAIGVNPVVVVVAILAGAEIAGFVGIILAVPTAVILQELVEDYERRKLKTQRLEIE